MSFFKGKAAKWIDTIVIGAGLTYLGAPAALVTGLSNWGGEQVEHMVTD